MKIEENMKKQQEKARKEAKVKAEKEKAEQAEQRRKRAEERQKEALVPKVNKQTVDFNELYNNISIDSMNVQLDEPYYHHSQYAEAELARQEEEYN